MRSNIKKGKRSKRIKYLKRLKKQRLEKKVRAGRIKKRSFRLPVALRVAICTVLAVLLLAGVTVGASNIAVFSSGNKIVENFEGEKYDCILVLGAGLRPDRTPSDMLADRLDVAIDLYKKGVAEKIVLSGDRSEERDYDEVGAMQKYCVEHGVAEKDIALDPYGFSTYESAYNLSSSGEYKSAVVVTQKYHLYRAIYCLEEMGITSVGADAALRSYRGQLYRDLRELAARTKDFFVVAFDKR